MIAIGELRQKLQLGDRPVALIIGAGLSSEGGPDGVPDAGWMLASIEHELTERGLGHRLERELVRFDSLEHYGRALDFVHQHAGAWLVDSLVSEAVLEARRVRTSLEFEGDGQPQDWLLPPATVGLARLLVEHPDVFAGPVLTTNFDPLLSLAIEAAGGVVDRRIVGPDGSLEPNRPRRKGALLIHVHGYWRGEPRHGPLYHMPSNRSARLVQSHLRDHRILVVGHRGRAGAITQALGQLAANSSGEIWWCFHAPEELARVRDKQLLEQLASWGANVLFGVDAHQLFDELTLAPAQQPRRLDSITNEIAGIELVHIPGGGFKMGSLPNEEGRDDDEGPQHEVTLDDFYLARTPVTNAQYARFLAAHSDAPKPKHWENPKYNQPEQPVVGISWEAAREYCKWAKLELPTEAQWEYACRGGTTTRYWSGDDEASLARVGWYDENSERRLHPMAEKEANPFGLHDMHGNVWEWCLDKFGPYTDSPPPRPKDGLRYDPDDAVGDADRVVRGGSWNVGARLARSAFRGSRLPGYRFGDVGFRPAQVITESFTPSP
jgi:formylglycine-generating enzyme required for sulfatase activity